MKEGRAKTNVVVWVLDALPPGCHTSGLLRPITLLASANNLGFRPLFGTFTFLFTLDRRKEFTHVGAPVLLLSTHAQCIARPDSVPTFLLDIV